MPLPSVTNVGNVDHALDELLCKTQTGLQSIPRLAFPDAGRHTLGAANAQAREALVQRNQIACSKLEELRKDIDNILDTISEQTRHNGFGPILDLPNSILAAIFCEAESQPVKKSQKLFSPYFRVPVEGRNVRQLRRYFQVPLWISHTCSHFRNVALHCRELWRDIDLRVISTQLAVEYAKRAQTSFVVTLDPEFSGEKKQFLLDNIHAISSITICDPASHYSDQNSSDMKPATWYDVMQQFNDVAAPGLSVLNISCKSSEPKEVDGFFQATPCLKDLFLKDIHIPWYENVYTGLVKVDLEFRSHIYVDPNESIMKLFASSPLLESVRLAFPEGTLVPTPDSEPVEELRAMTKLQRLELKIPYEDAYFILCNLATPPDMELILHGYLSKPTRSSSAAKKLKFPKSSFFSFDPRCLPCLNFLHTVQFREDDICAWRETGTSSLKIESEARAPKTFGQRLDQARAANMQILKDLCHSRWSHSIHLLRLQCLSTATVSLLWGLQNLLTLILCGIGSSEYRMIINEAKKSIIPLCPKLTSIGFNKVEAEPDSLLELLNTFPKLKKLEEFNNCILLKPLSCEVPYQALRRLRELGHTEPVMVQSVGRWRQQKYTYSIGEDTWNIL